MHETELKNSLCSGSRILMRSSDCKLYDIKIAQIIEVQLYLLKALTVEFRRQCQRKFDAAMLNVATNKNSRVFSSFHMPFQASLLKDIFFELGPIGVDLGCFENVLVWHFKTCHPESFINLTAKLFFFNKNCNVY